MARQTTIEIKVSPIVVLEIEMQQCQLRQKHLTRDNIKIVKQTMQEKVWLIYKNKRKHTVNALVNGSNETEPQKYFLWMIVPLVIRYRKFILVMDIVLSFATRIAFWKQKRLQICHGTTQQQSAVQDQSVQRKYLCMTFISIILHYITVEKFQKITHSRIIVSLLQRKKRRKSASVFSINGRLKKENAPESNMS